MFKSGRPERAGGWSQTYRHDCHTRQPEAAKLRRVSIKNVPFILYMEAWPSSLDPCVGRRGLLPASVARVDCACNLNEYGPAFSFR